MGKSRRTRAYRLGTAVATLGAVMLLGAAVSPGSSGLAQQGNQSETDTPSTWTVPPDEQGSEMRWATDEDRARASVQAQIPKELHDWAVGVVSRSETLSGLLDSGAARVVDESFWGNGGGVDGVALYIAFERPTTIRDNWPAYAYPAGRGEEAHAQRDVAKEATDAAGLPLTVVASEDELTNVTFLQILVASATDSIHSAQKLS